MTFNEITQNVVTSAIAHPRNIDYDLVDAQQARRILDRIVGYQLSPLLWKKGPPGPFRRTGAVGGHPAGGGPGERDPGFCPQGVLVPGCDPGPAGEAWLLCGEVPRGGEKAGSWPTRLRWTRSSAHHRQALYRDWSEEGGEKAERSAPLHHLHPPTGGLPEAEYDPQADHGHCPAAL